MSSYRSSGSLSSSKNDKITDKIIRQLCEDSESIDDLLRGCRQQRIAMNDKQKQALHSYEEDMARIGIAQAGTAIHETRHVDHNIMRHVNANNDSMYDYDFDGNNLDFESYDDAYKEIENLFDDKDGPIQTTTNSKGHKKYIPTVDEKIDIRLKLFAFLDQSRAEEEELATEYEKMKAEDSIRASTIIEELMQKQLENSDSLKAFFSDYQPVPFGKAWGKDPDYIKMTKKLKKNLVAHALLPEKPKEAPKKGRKH